MMHRWQEKCINAVASAGFANTSMGCTHPPTGVLTPCASSLSCSRACCCPMHSRQQHLASSLHVAGISMLSEQHKLGQVKEALVDPAVKKLQVHLRVLTLWKLEINVYAARILCHNDLWIISKINWCTIQMLCPCWVCRLSLQAPCIT